MEIELTGTNKEDKSKFLVNPEEDFESSIDADSQVSDGNKVTSKQERCEDEGMIKGILRNTAFIASSHQQHYKFGHVPICHKYSKLGYCQSYNSGNCKYFHTHRICDEYRERSQCKWDHCKFRHPLPSRLIDRKIESYQQERQERESHQHERQYQERMWCPSRAPKSSRRASLQK